jgi:hypothetical protein
MRAQLKLTRADVEIILLVLLMVGTLVLARLAAA